LPTRLFPKINRWYSQKTARARPTLQDYPTDREIPRDPQKFYEDFGLLQHPKTGLPSPKLTSYQYDVWKSGQYHKYRLVVKSQKIGLSTSVLMEDFLRAITTCKGREILVIAQTIDKARDHLYTLRRMILNSKKYKPYLILRRTELLLPDEVTKITVLFIQNPDNLSQPTKIIGLGGNEASIWSFKEVKHIHMSDIAVITKKDYSGVINAAMTRLANTDGTMIIETPPYGPRGKVYEIYMQSKLAKGDSVEGQFKLFTIPAREAVAANLITQEFLEGQKVELGSQYAAYYEAEFSAATGSVFHIEDVEAATQVPYDPADPLPYGGVSCIGIDPGFGSSPFGICVSTFIDGKARVLFADEFARPDHQEMALQIWDLIQHHNCNKVYIDNSSPSMIKSLKIHLGERSDYENIDREQYRFMKIEPVSFGKEHKNMLAHAKMMIDKRYVAIHKDFEKLIVSLKTAVEHNGSLDKEVTAYDNVFDAFRLCLLRYKEETKKP
jgi:hypothetical protein